MTTNFFQPFENEFFTAASKARFSFPDSSLPYENRYQAKVSSLRSSIYRSIDAGLSALSDEQGGIYTGHDSAHFDDVVKGASKNLSLPTLGKITSS